VRQVLAQAGLPRIGLRPRPSRIDPYLPFIHQTLEKFQKLPASRLYVMVHERGYPGSPHHFRHLIACLRPRPKAEAFALCTDIAALGCGDDARGAERRSSTRGRGLVRARRWDRQWRAPDVRLSLARSGHIPSPAAVRPR
jgi:hypothetical protein